MALMGTAAVVATRSDPGLVRARDGDAQRTRSPRSRRKNGHRNAVRERQGLPLVIMAK